MRGGILRHGAANKFSLQAGLSSPPWSAVRVFPPLLTLILLSSLVQAQEQERKLIDRLLRPNMTLRNSAQDKKFVTTRVGQARQIKTRRFPWQRKWNARVFGTREFQTRRFHSRSFEEKTAATDLAGRRSWKSDLVFRTRMARNTRTFADQNRKVFGRDFADNHPFRGQGKSQKALSQQDRRLTIDEVRELLNKNK